MHVSHLVTSSHTANFEFAHLTNCWGWCLTRRKGFRKRVSEYQIHFSNTCAGPASEARIPSRVCPLVGRTPRGSRGLVSIELQSTWRETVSRWTLRASLCQRRSSSASTPDPLKTQLSKSVSGSTPLALRDSVPSEPLRSTESWIVKQRGYIQYEYAIVLQYWNTFSVSDGEWLQVTLTGRVCVDTS